MYTQDVYTKPGRVHGLVRVILLSLAVQASGSQKAILIAGGYQTEDGVWPATDYVADRAYTTLLSRGFAKTDIRYLSLGPAHDVDGDGNAANDITHPHASRSDVVNSFSTWVGPVDTLTVFVVDHGLPFGGRAGFQLNATEWVEASSLDAWLDALQATHPKMKVTVVLDYSFAEQSLESLSLAGAAERRIVIASTGRADRAHFVSGGLISFSQHFFDGVRAGHNLLQCFNDSRDAMARFQGAGLDDDQDGVAGPLDGDWARQQYIGSDSGASVPRPEIGTASPNQTLGGETRATFFANHITASARVDRVWCAVVPPGYAPGSSPGSPVTEVSTREMAEDVRAGPGRYAATFDGFAIEGVYHVQIYAVDAAGGVSLPSLAQAEQADWLEKVVLVAAGDLTDSKFPAVRNLSKQVFLSLRANLLPPSQILYLSNDSFTDFDGDTLNDVDAPPTLLNLQNAIQVWAQDADQLTVYLIGQFQSGGIFRLSGTASVLALDVSAWLNQYQAPNRPAIVVMDFPSSEDFVSALTPYTLAPRTVIGSSRLNRTPVLADEISFSDFFANRLLLGESVGQAALWARTASRKASGNLFQQILINDNGNGISNEKGVDGQASQNVYIGTPFFPGASPPSIGVVMPETFLGPTASSLELFVSGVSDADGIASVRAHVTFPSNVADNVSREYPLSQVGMSSTWNALVPGFDQRGPYYVTFIAEDGVGAVRHTMPTLVLKTDSDRLVVTDPMTPDPREPDNSVGTARLTDPPFLGYQTLNAGNDTDWIKFYAWPDYKYDIGFLPVGGVLDLRVELYREVSNAFPDTESTVLTLVDTVDQWSNDGDEVVGLDFAAPGFYYLKISPSPDLSFSAGGYVTYSASLNILQGINVMVVEQGSPGPLAGASVTIRHPVTLQSLALPQFVGGTGLVNFPGFPVGTYVIDVNPQAAGYAGYFDPFSALDQPANPFSDYGNPRWIGPGDFETTQIEGGPSFQAAWAGFYFLPVAYVSGIVHDTVYGPPRPVENAFVSLTQLPDIGAVFQAWPWAVYGDIWWTTAQGQFPSTTRVLAGHSYALYVQKPHFQPWGVLTPNLAVGQTFNAGNVFLVPEDINDNGIPDPWEIEIFKMLVDGEADTDVDYTTHYEEYVAGTHPLNAQSVLRIPAVSINETGLQVNWTVEYFRNYRVYSATNPATGVWHLEAGPFASFGVASEMQWTDPESESEAHKAYMIDVRIWPN